MEALKINPPKIGDTIFYFMIKNAVCDTKDDTEIVGFTSLWMNYEISFYINTKAQSKLIVDDFGYLKNGEWVQCQPTKIQLALMQQCTTKKLEQLHKNNPKPHTDFNGDFYSYYGLSPKQFL